MTSTHIARAAFGLLAKVVAIGEIACAVSAAFMSVYGGAPASAQIERPFAFDRAVLATQEGAELALDDLRDVAERVCALENPTAPAFPAQMRACVEATLARAVAAIDAPLLTRAHRGQEQAPRPSDQDE